MIMDIRLPDELRVPALPVKYHVTPPSDLNKVEEDRFLLEYEFPYLIVREIALSPASSAEQFDADGQAGHSQSGYQLRKPSSCRSERLHCQLVPDLSFVDKFTWSSLTAKEKNQGYLPCTPAVVIELMTEADSMEALQAKVTKFMEFGAREGVIVDTRRDRIWIYNQNQDSFFDSLALIEFDSWPGFTLDCVAIRAARERYGLP